MVWHPVCEGFATVSRGARIGVNPGLWCSEELTDLGGDHALEACLADAAAAGYAGVELGRKFPRDPRVLKPLLADHDLELVAGPYASRLLERSVEEELRNLEPHLNLLVGMGCEVMTVLEVTGSVHTDRTAAPERRPVLHPGALRRLGEALTFVAEHAQARGVQLVYRHHVGTVISSEADIDHLMEATSDAVGLLADTGHLTWVGAGAHEVVARYGRRIRHVYLSDVRPGPLEVAAMKRAPYADAVMDGVFTVPGGGMVQWAPLFSTLDEQGYSGWLVVAVEQDPRRNDPKQQAAEALRFVKEASGAR